MNIIDTNFHQEFLKESSDQRTLFIDGRNYVNVRLRTLNIFTNQLIELKKTLENTFDLKERNKQISSLSSTYLKIKSIIQEAVPNIRKINEKCWQVINNENNYLRNAEDLVWLAKVSNLSLNYLESIPALYEFKKDSPEYKKNSFEAKVLEKTDTIFNCGYISLGLGLSMRYNQLFFQRTLLQHLPFILGISGISLITFAGFSNLGTILDDWYKAKNIMRQADKLSKMLSIPIQPPSY